MSFLEQTVIQAYFGGVGVLGRYPMDVAFDFDSISTSRAGLGVWQVFAVHDGDIASSVFLKAGALDHIAVAQAHRVIREQAEIALGRYFHEILTFYPKFARERYHALAQLRFLRMVGREAALGLILGGRFVDQLERVG